MMLMTLRRGSRAATAHGGRRGFSQAMADFVQPKYFQAYRALVLPQLKAAGLGESEADTIVSRATEAMESDEEAKGGFKAHLAAAHLALSTYDVVRQTTASNETGLKVAQQTLIAGQIFETSTHKFATLMSWNKAKHAEKVAKDFCRDQAKFHELSYDENTAEIRVKRCFYNEFFKARGCNELTKIFCAAEKALLSSADAPKSGVSLKVNTTIADGASSCTFTY